MCTKFYVSCSNTIDINNENDVTEIKEIFPNLKMNILPFHSENIFDSFIIEFWIPVQTDEEVEELKQKVFNEFKRRHPEATGFHDDFRLYGFSPIGG